MRQHECSGCTNPQIIGTSPFAPADFKASSTMCTRCFETQSSSGCTCTRRSKFLTHSLSQVMVMLNNYMLTKGILIKKPIITQKTFVKYDNDYQCFSISLVCFINTFQYSLLFISSILEYGFQPIHRSSIHHLEMTSSEGVQQLFGIISKSVWCGFLHEKRMQLLHSSPLVY